MAIITTWLTLIVFLLQSAPAAAPIRIGSLAQLLTPQDVTDLEQIATAGGAKGAPWLLQDVSGHANTIRMYLPAETQTAQVRRGRTIVTFRRGGETATAVFRRNGENVWNTGQEGQAMEQYAQVVETGRDFNSLTGDMDIHRPFPVSGTFSDEELIGLVTFIRTGPGQVEGSWPIASLRSVDSNSVTVQIAGRGRVQLVDLVRQGSKWTVTRARTGQP